MAETTSLITQTAYAELLDRCTAAVFQTEFPPSGSFVRATIKERDYWYFQQGARDASGRQPRKYVRPDSPDLRNRIEEHKRPEILVPSSLAGMPGSRERASPVMCDPSQRRSPRPLPQWVRCSRMPCTRSCASSRAGGTGMPR